MKKKNSVYSYITIYINLAIFLFLQLWLSCIKKFQSSMFEMLCCCVAPTYRLVGDLPYHLSYSHPYSGIIVSNILFHFTYVNLSSQQLVHVPTRAQPEVSCRLVVPHTLGSPCIQVIQSGDPGEAC